jgi:Ni/Co efflux regulator RcnB
MKKLIAALVLSSFLFAGAFAVSAATESQPEGTSSGAPASDQQKTPKKHHSHKGKHHRTQPKQTQGTSDLDSKK